MLDTPGKGDEAGVMARGVCGMARPRYAIRESSGELTGNTTIKPYVGQRWAASGFRRFFLETAVRATP